LKTTFIVALLILQTAAIALPSVLLLGLLLGMLAGYLIGYSAVFEVAGYTFSENRTSPIGMLIGIPFGGLFGFMIGSSIKNYKTLDLNQIFQKNKKQEILKLLSLLSSYQFPAYSNILTRPLLSIN
jgi:hypothetical protein